jgi:hypothetical protein
MAIIPIVAFYAWRDSAHFAPSTQNGCFGGVQIVAALLDLVIPKRTESQNPFLRARESIVVL